MEQLKSSLELISIFLDSHMKLHSTIKDDRGNTIGELELVILDENFADVNIVSNKLEPITARIINSFQVTYEGYMYDRNLKPFDQTPYIIWGRIAVLDRLYIYPEFRGRGYGRQIITQLIKIMKEVYRVDFIILKPYPLFGNKNGSIIEDVPTKRIIVDHVRSLISFYEQFNFKTQKINKQYFQCLCLVDYIYL